MYEAFYHLDTEPFRLCPDASFCFKHRSYAKARAYLQYAWYRAEGLAMVTGDPGTGKTTLANDLLGDLHTESVVVGRLVTTQVDADDLLRMVALAFGVEVDDAPRARGSELIRDFLAQQQRQGRRVLLIVDEAQDLARSALEELRLLTDLEGGGHYLLQVFLFGHRVLQDLLRQPELAPLQQRFIVACHLEPLDREGTKSYVRHRLVEAGWRDDPRIEDEVFPLIHQASRGVPRRINLVCSRLLLHGYAERQHTLGGGDVRQVVQDLRSEMLLSAEIEEQDDTVGTAGDQTDLVADPRPEPASVPAASANVFLPTGASEALGKDREDSGRPSRAERAPRYSSQKARVPAPYAAPMLPEPVQRVSTAGLTGFRRVRAAMQGLSRHLIVLLSFSGAGGTRDQRGRGYAGRYVLISLVASLALGVAYVAVPRVVDLVGSEAGTGASLDARRLTQERTTGPRPQTAVLHKPAQPPPSVTIIEASPMAPVMIATPPTSPGAEPRKPEPLPLKTIARVSKTSEHTDAQARSDRDKGGRAQKEPARPQAKQGRQARQAKQVARRSTASKQLVAAIQSRLLRAGHDPGPIDGIPGPRTRSAITAYQREWGLAADAGARSELLMHLIEHRRN